MDFLKEDVLLDEHCKQFKHTCSNLVFLDRDDERTTLFDLLHDWSKDIVEEVHDSSQQGFTILFLFQLVELANTLEDIDPTFHESL